MRRIAMKNSLRRLTRSAAPLAMLAACACLAAGGASPAGAASISIAPRYVQSYDSSLTPLGALANDGAATPVGSLLHYEFRMTVDDLEADEDFWIAIFNVEIGPGLEVVVGWMDPGTAQANGLYDPLPSLANYDSNGAGIGGIQSHWQFGNADFGLDPDDLQVIIVEASGLEAANRQYGEALRPGAGSPDGLGSPTLIGSILVRRTEMVPSLVSVMPIDRCAARATAGSSSAAASSRVASRRASSKAAETHT